MTATPTHGTAVDEMLGLFRTYWNANAPAVNHGVIPLVQWPGVDGEPPDSEAAYARVRVRHGISIQRTFGPEGSRRFTRPGLITVQLFSPLAKGGGLLLGQNLGIIARDAYEGRGTSSGIWFRNARLSDVGESDGWHQHAMVVEFEYDEFR